MNKLYFPSFKEKLFSEETEYNYLTNLKNISYKNISPINSSLNKTSKQTYFKIDLNQTGTRTKKNGASFCLNLTHNQERQKIDQKHNYTQHIILHTVKNKKKILEVENKLKKLKSEKNQKREVNYENNFNKENINADNIQENQDIKEKNANFILERNNIIRVIVSSEKIIKNFPMEYIHEMVVDICYHLLNSECTYDKIKSINDININEQNTFLFQESHNFFEYRKFYLNFLLQISLGTQISESTLFLSFGIFDRFLCSTFVNYDDFLLIIVTSFVLAIKYNESSEVNLDELCQICQKKFGKEEINKCEINIMEKLDYNLSIPTIFDLFQFIKIIKYLNEKEYYFGLFVLEMFVINGGNLRYNALIVIEAIYKLICQTTGKQSKNSILYEYLSNSGINIIKYEENINNCLLEIKSNCVNIQNNDFSVLINKFSDDKYKKISIDFQLI